MYYCTYTKIWYIIFNICSKSTVIFYKEYRYLYKEYGNKSLYVIEFKSSINFIKYYKQIRFYKGKRERVPENRRRHDRKPAKLEACSALLAGKASRQACYKNNNILYSIVLIIQNMDKRIIYII